MKLYEHQARNLFSEYGIPVPVGKPAATPSEAESVAGEIGGKVVVKAQVLTGGRGKAGGVKLAHGPEEAGRVADAILGMDIRGYRVDKVLVARAVEILHEYYISLLVERDSKGPMFIACKEGGVEIEQVAKKSPEKIKKWPIDPVYGLLPFQSRAIAGYLNPDPKVSRVMAGVFAGMYGLMEREDASLVEINPIILSPSEEVWAIDAKVTIDDNAMFRHEEFRALREEEDLAVTERLARSKGLSYVKLHGDVGCIVNGAGLAMATMDLIKYYGAEPANFLDIGGSSSPDKVTTALDIISLDSDVKSILLNIFGGITRCDDVANGVKDFLAAREVEVPVVIRLTGTNEEQGIDILKGLGLSATNSMDEAVRKVVERAKAA